MCLQMDPSQPQMTYDTPSITVAIIVLFLVWLSEGEVIWEHHLEISLIYDWYRLATLQDRLAWAIQVAIHYWLLL